MIAEAWLMVPDHTASSQEAEKDEHRYLVCFLLFIQSSAQTQTMVFGAVHLKA